jgi:DNA polymerase IV (DinB-like DNA polymerase)
MRLLEEYADVLEQTSIDEAFIDCTKKLEALRHKKLSHHDIDQSTESSFKVPVDRIKASIVSPHLLSNTPSAKPSQLISARGYKSSVEDYALKIKSSIREQCNGLVCSIGVASNKSIAKIASDFQKPDGLTIVYPQNTMTFLSKLKVDQVSGIGVKTAKTLKDMDINTIGELSQTDVQKLLEKFGKRQGLWMWQIANGRENDPVIPKGDNISLSTEETLLEPINDRDEILKILLHNLTVDIYKRLERKGYEFKTVGIKLVRTNFSIETREFTFPSYQRTRDSISSVMELLLDRFDFENEYEYVSTNNNSTMKKIYPSYIRKLGIKVSNLSRIDIASKRAQKSILDFI